MRTYPFNYMPFLVGLTLLLNTFVPLVPNFAPPPAAQVFISMLR